MNILMMTNTYLPHVGGVARSIAAFSQQYRRLGHKVVIIAPTFEGMELSEEDVVRIPAIQHFNGSDFSVVLPFSGSLNKMIAEFKPDIIHSHHPFLIGSTALRIANLYHIPHVFTHHTMYEQYTHYVPGDSRILKKFVIELASHYANLCDHIFVPSESIAAVLQQRQVIKPMSVIPTGVDVAHFQEGSGLGFRMMMNIPKDAFVVGHLGRLAVEKNIAYLAEAMAIFLQKHTHAYSVIVGKGAAEKIILDVFEKAGVVDRLVMVGVLEDPILASAYQAMDVFAFASQSETQGMVLTEAMAASVPVIALDAPGVREVVRDQENGRLLYGATIDDFANVLDEFYRLPKSQVKKYRHAALATAEAFSLATSAAKALAIYQQLITMDSKNRQGHDDLWSGLLPLIQTEWDLIKSYAESVSTAAFGSGDLLEGSEGAKSHQVNHKHLENKNTNSDL
jgi:glycosyltransferase involved in cell wall biosynthesis